MADTICVTPIQALERMEALNLSTLFHKSGYLLYEAGSLKLGGSVLNETSPQLRAYECNAARSAILSAVNCLGGKATIFRLVAYPE